jgi:hypothetical protein
MMEFTQSKTHHYIKSHDKDDVCRSFQRFYDNKKKTAKTGFEEESNDISLSKSDSEVHIPDGAK